MTGNKKCAIATFHGPILCKFVLMAVLLLMISCGCGLFDANEIYAEIYYVASNGNDSRPGTITAPWRTFVHAVSILKPDDTLFVMDGAYDQSLNVTVSGIKGHPISIKALNDGKAIIDGQATIQPCVIRNQKYINIEGLVFKNSLLDVVEVSGSYNITFRRVSAYEAGSSGRDNNHIFSISEGSDIFLEDCAASGYGRVMYDIYEVKHAVLRRCWGRWTKYGGTYGYGWIIQIYGSDNGIVENCVGTIIPPGGSDGGIAIWAHTYNKSANNNRIYGNVMHGFDFWAYLTASAIHNITGNRWVNDAAINNASGFFQRGDSDLQVDSITMAATVKTAFAVSDADYKPKDNDYMINSTVKNSSILSADRGYSKDSSPYVNSFSHIYNNLYGTSLCYYGTSEGTGERCNSLKPKYDVSTYGKGAYLIRPSNLRGKGENGADIGAEVLYRYQNGVLSNVPLWPWPMEERIFKETGISVTWEKHGGLWKTLRGIYPSGGTR